MNRITTNKQLTDLSSDFDNNGKAFTVYVKPTGSSYDESILLDVKLFNDDTNSNCPFTVNEWSPYIITKIMASNSSILSSYNIYIGTAL